MVRVGFVLGVLLVCSLLPVWAWGAAAEVFSEELESGRYDCTLTLTPAAKLPETSAVRVELDAASEKDYLLLTLTRQTLRVETVTAGTHHVVAAVASHVSAPAPYHLLVLRRAAQLTILHDETALFRGAVPRPANAGTARIAADRGWTVDESRVRQLAPVIFSDDFMRTAEEAGPWTVQQGQWALSSSWDNDPHGNHARFTATIFAQNPFAWHGHNADGAALCTTGQSYWEDYTLTAAVQPEAGAAAGLVVNMPDAKHGILIRWSPVNDHSARGDMLAAYALGDGEPRLLKSSHGGYLPHQWYRLTVVSSPDGLHVAVDGLPRLDLDNITPWRGGIGLYAEGANGATFDDITVYGQGVRKDLLLERHQEKIRQRFQVDRNGMADWADMTSEWKAGAAGSSIHRSEFYGDQWMTLTCTPHGNQDGLLCLVLNGNGTDVTAGYRAQISRTADASECTCLLLHDGTVLATKKVALPASDTDTTFRFGHLGTSVWLEQDGTRILEATDAAPATRLHPAYSASGAFGKVTTPLVMAQNVLDYSFSEEPTDWIGDGDWASTVRWACTPTWSFLSGWSRGEAVLWHKQRFSGDLYLQAFVGVKMEYPREVDIYDNRYRDFAITICGDGHNTRSGYTGIYAEGAPPRYVLLRNGKEVASKPLTALPNRGANHRSWFNIALRKHGSTVEFWVADQLELTYTDPQPIDGGVPAVWTRNNGICLARARLHFANPPTPRTDPRVVLDSPWYPEWGNVGQPLTLPFAQIAATSGQPVALRTEAANVPTGEVAVPSAQGDTVTVTPTVAGDHWYRVTADDGATTSPPFHLTLPVFTPALGRDDAHALVLYRFDEGTGMVIHDRSAHQPALNLNILDKTLAHWLPGQGLNVAGDSAAPIMSPDAASKLMAITRTNACTVELWVSADTIYPNNNAVVGNWMGCFFTWELNSTARNLTLAQYSESLIAGAGGASLGAGEDRAYAWCYRIGLQHVALTWDGTNTRLYLNGKKVCEKPIPWHTERWNAAAPLLLGNQVEGNWSFTGTYYLLAIHDACFTPEQIQRHYQAGPSAR